MKNILVPTDFSECALNAVKFAAELARKTDSTLHIAHMYQRILSSETAFNIKLETEIIAKEKDNLETYIDDLSQQGFMIGVDVTSSLSSVYKLHDILVMEKYHNTDLIVMGSGGVDGIKELFVGTNTQKFVQLADCPVIVIKDEVHLDDIKSIVFASDFNKEVIPKFKLIRDFASLIDAQLHYLKIMLPSAYSLEEEEMEGIANFAKATGIDANEVNLYKSVNVERGIVKFCEVSNADMIAIETHGRTGLSHLLRDNIAESLANHTVIPMFSVKIEEEREVLTNVVTDFLTERNNIANA